MPYIRKPLIIAVQQAIEGCLWLTLPVDPEGPVSSLLTLLFLLYAKVFWPAFAPITALLVEPEPRRRQLMAICAAAGAAIAALFLWSIYAHPHGAIIRGGHIVYTGKLLPAYRLLYCISRRPQSRLCLLSPGRRAAWRDRLLRISLRLFDVLGGFASVWCFFAAAGSVVILVHFERARQVERLARAGA